MVHIDEYANCIPNPEHMNKYTKAKVLHQLSYAAATAAL